VNRLVLSTLNLHSFQKSYYHGSLPVSSAHEFLTYLEKIQVSTILYWKSYLTRTLYPEAGQAYAEKPTSLSIHSCSEVIKNGGWKTIPRF